jgi:hypothetical protein
MHLWDRILPQAVMTLNMLPKLFWLQRTFLDNMTLIEHPWHPREQGLLLMKHLDDEKLGPHMGKMAGTLDQQWNITYATRFTSRKQDPAE